MPEKKTPSRARPSTRGTTKRPTTPPPGPDFDDAMDPDEDARPVAVGIGETDVVEDAEPADRGDLSAATADDDAPDAPQPSEPDGTVERPKMEAIAAALMLLLAGSMFLPIYRLSGFGRDYSAWQTGTFGPVIFFLALAGAAIAIMRLVGKRVGLPLEPSLIYEGIGYVALLGMVLKRLFPAKIVLFAGTNPMRPELTTLLYVPFVIGGALIFAAQASATSAPFVLKPRWLATAAGKLGAGILGGALILGLVFGFLNDGSPNFEAAATPKGKQFTPGWPACMRQQNFPLPAGVTVKEGGRNEIIAPANGNPGLTLCQFEASSKFGIPTLEKRYADALRKANFQISLGGAQGVRIISYSKPACGQISLSPDRAKKVTVIHGHTRPCNPGGRP